MKSKRVCYTVVIHGPYQYMAGTATILASLQKEYPDTDPATTCVG